MWLPSGYQAHDELETRRSRFRATLVRTDDEEAARTAVAAARRAHPDARHHCSAYIVEIPDANPVERSSDDGEPPGTAGMPMLDVLRASGLTNATVVVTRWFGGVKLGTGGLVRAYSAATDLVVAAAPRVRPVRRTVFAIDLDHAAAGRVQADLVARGVEITDATWAERVTLQLTHPDDAVLRDIVAHVTHGGAIPREVDQVVIEVPVVAPH